MRPRKTLSACAALRIYRASQSAQTPSPHNEHEDFSNYAPCSPAPHWSKTWPAGWRRMCSVLGRKSTSEHRDAALQQSEKGISNGKSDHRVLAGHSGSGDRR